MILYVIILYAKLYILLESQTRKPFVSKKTSTEMLRELFIGTIPDYPRQ